MAVREGLRVLVVDGGDRMALVDGAVVTVAAPPEAQRALVGVEGIEALNIGTTPETGLYVIEEQAYARWRESG